MAKGQQGGRGRQRRMAGGAGTPPPGGRARQRGRRRGRAAETPTALPGAAHAPAAASVFGSSVAAPTPAPLQPPARRARGGPRPAADREPVRRWAAVLDVGHVKRDLVWIGGTTAVSVGVVLILWVVLRV